MGQLLLIREEEQAESRSSNRDRKKALFSYHLFRLSIIVTKIEKMRHIDSI